MKNYKIILTAVLAVIFAACVTAPKVETPTDVLKKFVEASRKKDVEAIKQTLSAGTLKMLQESATKKNTTLDEILTKDDADTLKEMPEARNETIDGETAFVEIKNKATNDWDKIPFVKEDGKWKLAFDKFLKDLQDEINRQTNISNTKTPTTSGSETNSKSSPTPAVNK